MSKYAVLTTHLMAREDPVIEMTFDELDRVVSGLPASARKHSAWWSNSWTSQPHAFAWLDAGRLATPDFNAGRVRFVIGAPATGIGEKRRVARRTEAKHSLAELKATGESTEALIRYEWLGAGLVELVGGRPMMPRLPNNRESIDSPFGAMTGRPSVSMSAKATTCHVVWGTIGILVLHSPRTSGCTLYSVKRSRQEGPPISQWCSRHQSVICRWTLRSAHRDCWSRMSLSSNSGLREWPWRIYRGRPPGDVVPKFVEVKWWSPS